MTGFLKQLTGQPVTANATGAENEIRLSTTRDGMPLPVLVAAHGTSTGFTSMMASKALRELGTVVQGSTGYGHYMRVGSAGGETGAQRNGRVEVWVRR